MSDSSSSSSSQDQNKNNSGIVTTTSITFEDEALAQSVKTKANVQIAKQSEKTKIQIHEEATLPETELSGLNTADKNKNVKQNVQRPDGFNFDSEIGIKTTQKQEEKIPIDDEITTLAQTDVVSEKKQAGDAEKTAKYFAKKGYRKQSWFWHRQENPKRKSKGFKGYRYRRHWIFFALPQSEPFRDPISYEPDRNSFVLKVFAICGVMLLVTTCFTIFTVVSEDFQEFARSTIAQLICFCCMAVSIVISYAFACYSYTRLVPCNFILIVIANVAYTYIVGFVACYSDPIIVASAAGTTLIIVIICVLLAMTSFDFTRLILIVMLGMIAMFFASILVVVLSMILGRKFTILQIIITAICALLTSVTLIIEFQMILGGKSVELGEDEYAYGAFLVYTSIVTLFLQMLRLLSMILGEIDEFDDY